MTLTPPLFTRPSVPPWGEEGEGETLGLEGKEGTGEVLRKREKGYDPRTVTVGRLRVI